MIVDIEGGSLVTATWFDLWAAAVAIVATCLNQGYVGISFEDGLSVSLYAIPGGMAANSTADA